MMRWLNTTGDTPRNAVCPISRKVGTLRDFDAERVAFMTRVCQLKAGEADQVN
jgi:hypothetical protein